MQDAKQRVIEYLRQRQSEQSPQPEPHQRSFAPAPRPINLNLPPWGLPAMAITTIVAGSALMGTNMVLSKDPELQRQKMAVATLERQQETNAVVASEAVRNAGPRFNFCLGWCTDKQRQQQADPEPTEATPTPAPSALPTPAPAATQVANPPAAAEPTPAPHSWNQEVYNQWYSYYIAAIPGNWEGYVIRAATVQSSEFDTPEHERAFRDAFKQVEASRTPPQQPPSDDNYQPVSGEGSGFHYADYQNAGQSVAPFADSSPYGDPSMSRTPDGRPCRRRAMQPRYY